MFNRAKLIMEENGTAPDWGQEEKVTVRAFMQACTELHNVE